MVDPGARRRSSSLDEGEGSTVEDITGNGHTATIEGAEWTNGKYGSALYFNDEESCATVADAPDLQLPEEFTVETWVKPQGTGVNEPLISKETEGFFSYSLYLGLQASGKIEGLLGGEEEEIGPDVESDESLPLNVWSHVAMTYDGAHMRLYVNGELQDTAVAEDGAFSSSGPLKFGCSEAYEDDFKGRIDELAHLQPGARCWRDIDVYQAHLPRSGTCVGVLGQPKSRREPNRPGMGPAWNSVRATGSLKSRDDPRSRALPERTRRSMRSGSNHRGKRHARQEGFCCRHRELVDRRRSRHSW
jgi:Concanavalin A-like lectin/glucanases superfamily